MIKEHTYVVFSQLVTCYSRHRLDRTSTCCAKIKVDFPFTLLYQFPFFNSVLINVYVRKLLTFVSLTVGASRYIEAQMDLPRLLFGVGFIIL